MGIADRFNRMANSLQVGVKTSSTSFLNFFLKIITGFTVGLTFALVGQEMMSYGNFSFILMLAVTMGAIFKLLAKWSIGAVVLFDLFCVLVALLLRMYILLAP